MSDVSALEQQIQDNKLMMENRERALKLFRNLDFKKIILDGFMRDEAARYVQLSCDPSLTAEQRADALGLAQASGHLKRYLSVVVQMGHAAENQNKNIEMELAEARAEEDQLQQDEAE